MQVSRHAFATSPCQLFQQFRQAVWLLPAVLAMATWPVAAEPLLLYSPAQNGVRFNLEGSEPRGIYLKMVRYIERESGVAMQLDYVPWKRAQVLNQMGRVGLFGASFTPERANVNHLTLPVDVFVHHVIIRKEDEPRIRSLDDLRGKVLGASAATVAGEEFEAFRRSIGLEIERDTLDTGKRLVKLAAGRIDFMLVPADRGPVSTLGEVFPILGAKAAQLTELRGAQFHDVTFLAIPKLLRKADELARIDAAIRKGWRTGVFEARYAQHFGREVAAERAAFIRQRLEGSPP